MMNLSRQARAERLAEYVNEERIISIQMYNLVLSATVLYGLVVNALLCRSQIITWVFSRIDYFVFLVVYFISVIAGIFISRKTKNVFVSFIGYNLIVVPIGLVVGLAVTSIGYDSVIVRQAFITTAGVTVIMMTAGLLFPDFMSRLGSVLTYGIIGVLFALLLSLFMPGISVGVAVISAGLFSLLIGYDVYRSQQFPRTALNAVNCAVDIYLDIINLFLDLLIILSRTRRRR